MPLARITQFVLLFVMIHFASIAPQLLHVRSVSMDMLSVIIMVIANYYVWFINAFLVIFQQHVHHVLVDIKLILHLLSVFLFVVILIAVLVRRLAFVRYVKLGIIWFQMLRASRLSVLFLIVWPVLPLQLVQHATQ